MDENLHDIDKLFRDPIEEHEDMPSARVWDAIDANLDKSNIVSIKKKYNNLKKIAVALLLLLLGAVVYEIQTAKTGDKNTAVNTVRKDDTNGKPAANTNSTVIPGESKNIPTENQDLSWEDSTANNYTTNNAIINTDDKTSTLQDKSINKTEKEKVEDDVVVGVNEVGKVNEPNKVGKVNKVNKVDKVNGGDVVVKGNKVNTVNKKGKVNRGVNVADEDAQTADGSTTAYTRGSKKASVAKTKIRIQNGTAVMPDDAFEQLENNNSESATAAELLQPENKGVEKMLATSLDNGQLKQITAVRVSPDAKLKNKIWTPKPFHISITPFVSPQFSFNRIIDDRRDPGPQPPNGREKIKAEEQKQTAVSAGLLAEMPLGKNWSIQSGITFTNRQTSIEPKKIFAKMDADGKVKYRFDCASGYTFLSLKTGTGASPAVGDSVTLSASTNTLKYIGIPLALNYTINLGKFTIAPSFGAVANFLVKQSIETEVSVPPPGPGPIPGSNEKQKINTIQGLKPNYFNAFTGIAFEYNFNKRMALSLVPSGNFALTSINKDAAVKSYPNSFGIAAGLKIKL